MYKLFYNAKFHTLDDHLPDCTALVVHSDRIVFCGTERDINLPDRLVEKVNLHGLNIYPGFTDCHTHVAAVALSKKRIRLDHCQTLASALKIIEAHVRNIPTDTWITGSGWNANIWPDGQPNKTHLDRISAEHPIALYNKDGHTQWLNSKALALSHIGPGSADPPGGKLGRDKKGELTGLVYEKACDIVNSYSEKISYNLLYKCMQELYPELYSCGITGVHSCESLDTWIIFQQLFQNDALKIRVCMHPPVENAEKLIESGLSSAFGNEWLRLGGLKYFVDGSLGSQTAEMFDNYQGLNHAGIEVLKEPDLFSLVKSHAEKGWSATIHAIGDKANHKTLNALEKTYQAKQQKRLRHRIEHAQIIADNDLPRFAALNVIASMQPMHIADDVKLADQYLGDRSQNAYRVSSLIRSGARVVFGSDMPIADFDPLKGILAATTRQYLLDQDQSVWNKNECTSSLQALHAYTKDAAFASYEENLKGTLSPGKVADFFGLKIDLEKASVQKLRKAKVELTVMAGNVVFQKNNI